MSDRWWDSLSLETLRALQTRHPGKTLDEIAVWAIQRPGYDELFARLSEHLAEHSGGRGHSWVHDSGRLRQYIPIGAERPFRELVVAAALEPVDVQESTRAGPKLTLVEPEVEEDERYGKEYPGPLVEEVVRLAHTERLGGRQLGRTLRNELYEKTDATTYMIDTVFRLMKDDELADAGRQGWLKVAGQASATPAFINLHDLETSS